MTSWLKFIHVTSFNVFQARCWMKLMRDLTPFQRFFNRFFFFFFLGKKQQPVLQSLLPRRTNAIFICSSLQWLKLPAGTPGYFSPPSQLLHTMPHMPRGENRRSARSVTPTMWRTCSVFCAWSLLFLTEVCAQSQRRYTFIYIFFFFQINFKALWVSKVSRISCSLWRSSVSGLEFI